MMEKKFNKLVRDKIPEIIESNGEIPSIRVLSDEECNKSLNEKLKEELNEVINSKNKDELKEELADLLEVIIAKANINGITYSDIENVRQTKKQKRGAFDKKIYLISTKNK